MNPKRSKTVYRLAGNAVNDATSFVESSLQCHAALLQYPVLAVHLVFGSAPVFNPALIYG